MVLGVIILWGTTPDAVWAADVTLAWNANTQADLAGYRVFTRQEGQPFDYSQPAWQGAQTTCDLYGLADEVDHFFVVRAVNDIGEESVDSNEICLEVPMANLQFSLDRLELEALPGDSPLETSLTLASDRQRQVAYSLQPDAGWLQVTQNTGTTPGQLTVRVDPGALVPGDYAATLTAQAHRHTAAVLPVLLTVNVPPVNEADYGLLHSDSPDRSNPAPLNGQTVANDIFVFIGATDQVQRVTFYVDGAHQQVEELSPFDMAGGSREIAEAFDTTVLANGRHTIRARIELENGQTFETEAVVDVANYVGVPPVADAGADQSVQSEDNVVLDGQRSTDPHSRTLYYDWLQTGGPSVTVYDADTAAASFQAPAVTDQAVQLTFALTVTNSDGVTAHDHCTVTVQPNTPQSEDNTLYYSPHPDRSVPRLLDGAVLSGRPHIFLNAAGRIWRVYFYVNQKWVRSEWRAPYDLSGTARNGDAEPTDLMRLFGEGYHQLTAIVQYRDGSRRVVESEFWVQANN